MLKRFSALVYGSILGLVGASGTTAYRQNQYNAGYYNNFSEYITDSLLASFTSFIIWTLIGATIIGVIRYLRKSFMLDRLETTIVSIIFLGYIVVFGVIGLSYFKILPP